MLHFLFVLLAGLVSVASAQEFVFPDTATLATGVTALLVIAGALILAWRGVHLFRRGAGQIK